MGRLTVDMFVTLDGVIQAPGGPREDTEGGFKHGGWQAPLLDDKAGRAMGRGIDAMDALVLGRKTYDVFADYWPKASKDMPIAKKLNAMPKYVASRTLKTVGWNNSQLIKRDLVKAIRQIKKEHDDVHTIGSADLVQSLLKAGLVDRLNLWVHPIILGSGKRLFGTGTIPLGLRLVESKTYATGVVHVVYDADGKPEYGDMT